MNSIELLEKLSSEDWSYFSINIYDAAKSEMQSHKGLIRHFKEKTESARKTEINNEVESFSYVKELIDMDFKINELASNMLSINESYSRVLYYDFMGTLAKNDIDNEKYPFMCLVKESLSLSDGKLSTAQERLKGIVFKVLNGSLSQANKSNAGEAGENLMRAILNSVSLKKDVHYREQYKSKSGSDTDFALPFVEDYRDQDVDAMVAVQLSSNDRTRLVSSELKKGANTFIFTGNGLDSSKKKLKDVGSQILNSLKDQNIRMICYSLGLQEEICRLKRKLEHEKKKEEAIEIAERLEYFENYSFTITKFQKYLYRFSD